jgi:hypothetical protein
MANDESLLVYFPMLSVPASGWLVRQLLYCDRLLVPTPSAVAGAPGENFDDFTRELMDRGLVGYEFPENHFDAIDRSCASFAQALDSVDVDARRRAMDTVRTFGIHEGKTARGLLQHLGDVGLAAPGEDGWWDVEQTTAHEYMAAAAFAIAVELGATAVTDSDVAAAAVVVDPAVARAALLGDALPSPESVDLDVLQRVRQRRDDLLAFRRETERYAFLVARAATPAEADRWRQEYRDRVGEAEDDLAAFMSGQARAGRVLEGPFGGLVAGRLGAVVGTVQTIAGWKAGPKPPDPDFTYSAAARRAIRN